MVSSHGTDWYVDLEMLEVRDEIYLFCSHIFCCVCSFNEVGHVLGFLHTGFLLIQQSLIFTPMHLNRYWRLLIESWVTIHGGVVAMQTISGGHWGMFMFGFLWMFVFTQIHGIPYYLGFVQVAEREQKKQATSNAKNDGEIAAETEDATTSHDETCEIPYEAYIPTAQWKRWLLRLAPVVVYFGIVVACYATVLKPEDQTSIGVAWIGEIIRIPSILYLLALFTVLVSWGMMTTHLKYCSNTVTSEKLDGGMNPVVDADLPISPTGKSSADEEEDEEARQHELLSPTNITFNKKFKNISVATSMAIFVVCFTLMVVISIIFESIHIEMTLIVLMVVCVAIFTVLSLVAMIFLEHEQERVSLGGPQQLLQEKEEEEQNNETSIPTLSTTFKTTVDYSMTFKYDNED